MKTSQLSFLEFLAQPQTRFAIPIFQRVYSWADRECEEFWDDALRAGHLPNGHFMGVVLYADDPEGWHAYKQVNIIDGQQRMTTLSLLLVALSHYLREHGGTVAGMTADDLLDRYLRIMGAGDEHEGKLVLTHLDTYTLFSLVAGLDIPEEHAQRVIDNYGLFAELMREPGFDPERLWRGLAKLRIVAIELTGEDGPQLVFESLNGKGMSLVTGDLVKNQILMADAPRGQIVADELAAGSSPLYERYWLPLEQSLDEVVDCDVDMTRLIHAWMASLYRYEHIHDESEIYGLFKEHVRLEHDGSLERTLIELRGYARRFAGDEKFRADSLANAHDWLEGKPVRFVSELKLFGD